MAVTAGVLLLGAGCLRAPRSSTPAPATAHCFPVERLSPDDRAMADRLLLQLGDGEALYTLAGGLKPVSSEVIDASIRVAPSVDTVALARIDQLRRVTAALSCGEVGAFVQLFAAPTRRADSTVVRQAAIVVYHRHALETLVRRQSVFFGSLGLSPAADPRDLVAAVEYAERAPRWRGYGYLFGYPDAAVDFFVEAGEEGDRTGRLVPRDFRRIETVRQFPETRGGPPVLSAFVYAVPKGAPPSADDLRLQTAAAPLLARYRMARARYITPDSSGALLLWRAWFAAPTP